MPEYTFNPSLSVGEAKRQVLYDKPTLSVEEAKAQLYGTSAPVLSVSEAKQQLLSGSPTKLSVGDAKRQLLAQASQVKKEAITPAPLPLPVEPIAPVGQVEPTAESGALLTDQQVDSLSGGVANVALGVFGGAAAVVGDAITFVPQLGNLLQGINLTEEDRYIAQEIQGKQDAGIDLSEGEQAYFDAEKGGKLARIKDIKAKSEFISAIKVGVESVQSWQNQAKQQIAIQGVQADASKAAEEFSNGDYIAGFSTFVGGMVDLAIENPAAAFELTANSLPQMLALQFKMLPAIASLSVSNTGEALKGFEEEYGRRPNDSETAIALVLSIISAGADALGARLVFSGNKLLASTVTLAKATGLQISKQSLIAARKALASTSAKGSITSVKAVGGETITEGTQNVLDQLAAKQDPNKVSIEEALTDAIIGGVSGGILAGPNVIGSVSIGAAATVRKTVHKVATKAKDTLVEQGIGATDTILAKAEKDNKPEVGIKEIQGTNFADLKQDKQYEYLDQFEDFIGQYADDVNFDADKLLQYERDLNTLYDKVDELNAAPVKESVDTLTDKEATPKQSKEAADNLVANVRNSATVSPVEVKRSLGSDSSFRDNATPEQIKVVEDLNDFQDAVQVARNIDNVTDNVLKGSKDSKFVGIETHMDNAKTAIRKGDTEAVNTVLTKLGNFLSSQKVKLDIKTHSPKFYSQIENEVKLIEATIQQIKTLSGGVKTEAKPKAKPSVKPKVVSSAKDLFEYKEGKPVKPKTNVAKLAIQLRKSKTKGELATIAVETNKILAEIKDIQYTALSKIDITREEGEEAVTFNAAQEYETLTKRMSGLEIIWKECK